MPKKQHKKVVMEPEPDRSCKPRGKKAIERHKAAHAAAEARMSPEALAKEQELLDTIRQRNNRPEAQSQDAPEPLLGNRGLFDSN